MHTKFKAVIVQKLFCIMSLLHGKGDIIENLFCIRSALHFKSDIIQKCKADIIQNIYLL